MIRTQIRLSEDQAAALKELARRENVSIAELVRQAIDHWLRYVDTAAPSEKRRRALEVVGRFHSGESDISERHNDYLMTQLP